MGVSDGGETSETTQGASAEGVTELQASDVEPVSDVEHEPVPDADDAAESVATEQLRADEIAEVVGLSKARYDRETLLRKGHVEDVDTRRWWRAMGIVEVPEDVVGFGPEDLAMVRALRIVLSRDERAEEHIYRLARLLGGSFSRIAEAQTQVIEDLMEEMPAVERLETPAERADALRGDEAGALIELFDQSMTYVWRRHLFAALGRWVGADANQTSEVVGFIDISGFSRMSKRVAPEVLGSVVERFESEAIDVVSGHGGRVVKFIGDEVFFVVDDVGAAVDLALDLGARMAEGTPSVGLHTGIAVGPTVTIAGDVFGTTVNLAKRLTDVARKGKIYLAKDDAAALVDREDLVVRRVSRRLDLKSEGRTSVVNVSRRSALAGDPDG